MRITKLEHSGIILEKDGKKLVFDPVEFIEKLPEISNVTAVIITHKHGDHFQPEQIAQILEDNPSARIFAVGDIGVDEIADRVVEKIATGTILDIDGFHLRFFGHDHAAIVPGAVPCQNIGVVVDHEIVNPGDSFDIPELAQPVKVLFVPSAAPWCKVAEGMDYIKQVQPEIAVPVHDAVLSELGRGFNNNWLTQAAEEIGAKLVALKPGESLEI